MKLYHHPQPGSPALPLAHEVFVFTGGEPHIKITAPVESGTVTIAAQVRSAQDMLLVLLANDALRRMGVAAVDLFIPYFPAARQDRLMVPGEPLSVKVYADMVNQAQFRRVTVFDPHSEVTPALLDRCTAISNHAFIRQVTQQLAQSHQLTLIAPDAGAAKKIHHLAAALSWEQVVQCDKVRDLKTGNLSAPKVFSDDLQGADCLIVDDICDGGGTFVQLAQALKNKNAGKVYLAISHGIFSKGLDVLAPHFEQVFTTDSFCTLPASDFLKIHTIHPPSFHH